MAVTSSTRALVGSAFARLLAGPVVLGAILFSTAGTVRFWQAWVYMAVLFVPLVALIVYLLRTAPDLLERRMRMKESAARQKAVIGLSALVFLVAFSIPGFDYRYGWSRAPVLVVLLADVLVLVGLVFYGLVLRENRYAARTIAVDAGQQVITTGPYSLVRHPMYLAMTLLLCASPLALGSYWGVLPMLALPLLLASRIVNEEDLLTRELVGYSEYKLKTKWRLFPGIW